MAYGPIAQSGPYGCLRPRGSSQRTRRTPMWCRKGTRRMQRPCKSADLPDRHVPRPSLASSSIVLMAGRRWYRNDRIFALPTRWGGSRQRLRAVVCPDDRSSISRRARAATWSSAEQSQRLDSPTMPSLPDIGCQPPRGGPADRHRLPLRGRGPAPVRQARGRPDVGPGAGRHPRHQRRRPELDGRRQHHAVGRPRRGPDAAGARLRAQGAGRAVEDRCAGRSRASRDCSSATAGCSSRP